jgi:hypothetical protein
MSAAACESLRSAGPVRCALALLGAALAGPLAAAEVRDATVHIELVVHLDGVPVYAEPFDLAAVQREIDRARTPRERSVIEMRLRPRPIAALKTGTRVIADRRRQAWYRIRLSDGGRGWIVQIVDAGVANFSAPRAPVPPPPPPVEPAIELPPPGPVADDRIELARPMGRPLPDDLPPIDPARVEPPTRLDPRETIPLPDRWRIVDQLGLVGSRWWDPYHPNPLKGDRPLAGTRDWFFNLGLVSDTLFEQRRVPTAVGPQTTARAGSDDVFGNATQSTFAQNLIVNLALTQGDTTFRPPDYEFRFVPVVNVNVSRADEVRALRIDPREGTRRRDLHVGIQELFADKHLRDVSDRYDFDSLRIGIQPFISDFRGFVFNDLPFGVRLFGTRDNNRWQYNVGWFRRLEKDTNSGLNDVSRRTRDDDVFVANVYRQDFPWLGFTLQGTVLHNVNREDAPNFYDNNGFLARPAAIGDMRPLRYRVTYLGVNGDGHIGTFNLSAAGYLAFGSATHAPLAQQPQSIRAGFVAAELSKDFSWLRARATALYASGDRDPFDDRATGFDAIVENPQIAGADTSYWIRQAVPLIGGGGVALSTRNGVLASLRSSKEHGQSNFVNPGVTLVGIGGDADLLPQLRLVANVNRLWFTDTSSVEVLRNQGPIDRAIGTDVSLALQYRPLFSQNVVFNASAAVLAPARGFRELYATDRAQVSLLFNMLLTF